MQSPLRSRTFHSIPPLALALSVMAVIFTRSPAGHTIVGGEWVERHADAPFMVLVDQGCGATVVSEEWALTAAHCIDPKSPPRAIQGGALGKHSLPERHGIQEVIVHPKYERILPIKNSRGIPVMRANRYDFALLRLNPKIDFTRSAIRPVRIADADFVARRQIPGTLATFMGWGSVEEKNAVGTTHLRYVDVPIVSYDEANKFESYGGWIDLTMIPTGWPEGGRDACSGDSGGPLLIKDETGTYQQIGIISWGLGCAVKDLYGISSNLSIVPNWLRETMATAYVPPAPPPKPAPRPPRPRRR